MEHLCITYVVRKDVPDVVVQAIRKVVERGFMEHVSFPNGSAYNQFSIPLTSVEHDGVLAFHQYNNNNAAKYNHEWYSFDLGPEYGPGPDLGVHFFGRNQVGLEVVIRKGASAHRPE